MNKFRSYFSVAALALAVSLTGCSVVRNLGGRQLRGRQPGRRHRRVHRPGPHGRLRGRGHPLRRRRPHLGRRRGSGRHPRGRRQHGGGRLAVGRCNGRRRHGHHQRGRHVPPLRQPVRRPGGGRRRRGRRGAHHPGRGGPQQFHRFPVCGPERQRGHHLPRGRHHQCPPGRGQLRGPGRGLPQRRALFHG